MTINEVIRKIREDREFSQQNIADELGVDVSTINRWEKPGIKIKSEFIEKMAGIFKMTVADLYNYRDNPLMLNEPIEYYRAKKEVNILVKLDGSSVTLNEWFLILKKLNAVIGIFLFFVLTTSCHAQNTLDERIRNYKVETTTQEEYNYLTKGYRETVEKGLDVKNGYTIKDLFEYNLNPNYSFTFKHLIRDNSRQLAGTLVIARSKAWNNVYYLCIPNAYGLLYEEYYKTVNTWDRAMLFEYFKAYSAYTESAPNLLYIINN